jgi:two-component system, LytTR family, response regulator
MRVLIADDEPLARRALTQLLARHPDVVIAAECSDGVAARQILSRESIDVALLDIRMPELSGLDAAAVTDARKPLIVFVTAHQEFGVPAFERGAVDYLLKPVTEQRVDAALERLRLRLAADADAARYRALAGVASRYDDRLVARVGDRDVIIPVGVVELIAADDVYAAVHAGGRRYLVRRPLDDLEQSLSPAQFVRVHRSYIVARDAVSAVRHAGGNVVVELRNGATIPVSRRRRSEVARLGVAVRDTSVTVRDKDTPS